LLVAKVLKDQEDNSILIQDLLESKKDLSTTLNSIADAVISTDIKGIVVNMNPVAEKLCGWSEKEAIGKSLPEIFNIINSETRESILNPVGKVLESGRVTGLSNHTVLISKDGNEYHISDSAAPIRNDKNSITGFVMVFSDITEKYNATRELNERNIFIQTVLDNLPIGVSISEFDNGNITYMNKKFIEIFGWTEEELTSIDVLLEKFYPDEPNKQQLTEKILADIKSSDKSKTQLENVKITTKSGHKRIINAVNIPLFVMNSIVSTVSDITNLKKAEEELQKIAKLESLGVLAGGIAHNFKNMLTAMNMNLELAKMKPDNTPYYLDRMEKSIDQASALATRFQTFSASGKPVLSLTDINNTIREAVEIALSGSQASVHYNLDNQISKVLADDKQLNEVFTNLIINADQAMPKGGNIYISSSLKEFDDFEIHNLPSGKFIEISIKDDGIGISDEYISDIFTPFFSTKTKGQGLGLASVYYIVEKHKGAVTVSSEINMGATFNIYLPLLVDMEDTNNNSEDTILKNRNLRILLLDDDISIVENFKDISGILEFELIGLSNPHETLRFYKKIYKEKFLDFVILDLTLKGFEIDGHDVLLELKRINPKVRALVFSGHSTKPIVADYKKYGFVGRIEKPFLLKQFISEINRLS
jgi:PAS domain S-box-containing protein